MDSRRFASTFVPPMLVLAACAGGVPQQPPRTSALDVAAEEYVRLVLAVGRHDALYVDAYYGPPAWKTESEAGTPMPLAELLARTRALLDEVRRAAAPADRARYLEKQLIAVEGHLRRLSGEPMTLTQECRALYDADPPHHDATEFAAAQAVLESLVPGEGPLGPRIETLRRLLRHLDSSFKVPPARHQHGAVIQQGRGRVPPGRRHRADRLEGAGRSGMGGGPAEQRAQ